MFLECTSVCNIVVYIVNVLFDLMCYHGYWYMVTAGTCMCCCYLACTCIQDNATPVYMAAKNGHVGALKALISAGAELNTADVVSMCQFLYVIIVCTIPHLKFNSGAKYRNRVIIVD